MPLFNSGPRGERPSIPSWSIAFRAPEDYVEFETRLPSGNDGLWFDAAFAMEVTWNGFGKAERRRALAELQREVIKSAGAHSARFSLGDKGAAEAELKCELADDPIFERAEVRAHQVAVELAVDPEDMKLAKELEVFGPRNEIRSAAHRARMERVRELQRDVLVDSVLARVWWFEQHPEQLHAISEIGDKLDELLTPPEQVGGITAEGGHGTETPVMDAFLADLEVWERSAIVDRLVTILEGFERTDLAERLRRQWSAGETAPSA
ncbi:hypothetical protein [Nocardiopsis halophila]|uniref:hypothetical protein n=1 Tax=Nocardiopsis halophila TaxID=141692 RepID=UPI000347A2B8|nr:hypothetical protein [Nocardiopsis halophila]